MLKYPVDKSKDRIGKIIYIGLYLMVVSCDLFPNEIEPVTFVSSFSEGDQLRAGDIVSFSISSNLNEPLFYKLGLLNPENEADWNPSHRTIQIEGEETVNFEVPDVVCKNACYFHLTIWKSGPSLLLDKTITVDIIKSNFDNKNRFLPTSVENSYIYIHYANRWDGPEIDPISISNGYISVDSYNSLNALDFKVHTSEGRIQSFLKDINFVDHGLFFTEFSSDLYRLDINKYDSTFFYLDETDIAIPFSTNSDDYFFNPEGYGPFIKYMGDENISLGEESFEAKKFKGGHSFVSFEFTFIKDIGISRYKENLDGGEYEFILKGAVVDGVVYGDTSRVIN